MLDSGQTPCSGTDEVVSAGDSQGMKKVALRALEITARSATSKPKKAPPVPDEERFRWLLVNE